MLALPQFNSAGTPKMAAVITFKQALVSNLIQSLY
jgi:hypothetical protein